MSSYAAELASQMLKRSGYVPNVGNLDVRPGTILSISHGRYKVEGTLDQRAKANGDTVGADQIRAAMTRIDPVANPASGDRGVHAVGLSYKSEGTTIAAPKGGLEFSQKIPGAGEVSIKVDVLMSFSSEKSYLFDTTEPAPWHTFSPDEMNVIAPAALNYLAHGELLVTGVAFCTRWVWYISKAREGAIGFSFDGSLPTPPAVNVANFADIKANLGLNVTYDKNEVVDGEGANSVAAFACVVKKVPWLGEPNVVPHALPLAFDLEGGGATAIAGSKMKDVLVTPEVDDILPLVRIAQDG